MNPATDINPSVSDPARRTRIPQWSWAGLIVVLLFDIWWRGHTFGPTVLERTSRQFWPVVEGQSEPLDCDEAAYGYIGRRLDKGAVLYRDLVENKPPVGYWIYALAIRLGGANELTIRLLPIPFVLGSIALVWMIGLRTAGPGAGCLAALIYALMSTDPFLFGNGSNLEHAQNFFGLCALAAYGLTEGGGRPRPGWLAASGLATGLACGIKQVGVAFVPVFVGAILLSRGPGGRRGLQSRLIDLSAFVSGLGVVAVAILATVFAQGAAPEAYESIVRYGAALATDTPPPLNAPPGYLRLLTGNSDPRNGALPWPFGRTDWLVWWGTGSWPLWLASIPALGIAALRGGGRSRLLAAWTLAGWVAVALPGQYWQHYYLIPAPGIALLVATTAGRLASRARTDRQSGRRGRSAIRVLTATLFVAATAATAGLQVRDYLLVPPTELTVRYKGGSQWVRLREIGREIRDRTRDWPDRPGLYVWGWQSPLYFYSGLDSPTRHFFANELLKAYADRPHPLITPWIAEIRDDLKSDPPTLIFTGDRPFPGLDVILRRGYRPSTLVAKGPFLWVDRPDFERFEDTDRRN